MLILARHGRTTANARRLLLGRLDLPLDEVGEAQAEAIGVALSSAPTPPARVIASPLQRARITAEAIAQRCGVSVEIDDRFLEVDYGEFDGAPLAEVPHEVWQHWRTNIGWVPPGGESLAAVGERVRAACASYAEEAADRDVVVVTHVSPIKAAVAWALATGDEAAWRMFCDVASISRVRTVGANPTLVSFNETAHLAAVGDR